MVYLFFNLSTKEPLIRLRGARYPLSSRDNAVIRWLRGGQPGLYFAATEAEKYSSPEELEFPILQPAIRFVKRTAGRVDRIILVATDAAVDHAKLGDDDPRRDDTCSAAVLAQAFITAHHPEIATEKVLLTSLRNQLYGEARKEVRKLPEPGDEDCVYVCTSPGLPAVNDAVVQRLLARHSGDCTLFQIEEPDPTAAAEADIERIAISDILTDFRLKDIHALVEAHDYNTAVQVLERMPRNPGDSEPRARLHDLLMGAGRQWMLEEPHQVPGKWGKYFWRVLAGMRKAEAFRAKNVDEWLAWLGDSAGFAQELMGAIATNDETIVTQRSDWEKKNRWQQVASEQFAVSNLWAEWQKERQKLVEFRNDYTHRLLPADPGHLPPELSGIPERFDVLLNVLATKEDISPGDSAPKLFREWNQDIFEAGDKL